MTCWRRPRRADRSSWSSRRCSTASPIRPSNRSRPARNSWCGSAPTTPVGCAPSCCACATNSPLSVVRIHYRTDAENNAMLLTPKGFEPRIDLALDDDAIVHLFVRDRLVHSLDETGAMRWAQYRAMGFSAERVHSIGRYHGETHVAVALSDD